MIETVKHVWEFLRRFKKNNATALAISGTARHAGGLVFFQVGCFYEFYARQARTACDVLGLTIIPGRYGFRQRCGIGVKALDRCVAQALKAGLPVTVVNQTGLQLGHVAERRTAVKYLPAGGSDNPSFREVHS